MVAPVAEDKKGVNELFYVFEEAMTRRIEGARKRKPRPLPGLPEDAPEGTCVCTTCRKVVYRIAPWQDICPCGASLPDWS